ncbi:hypothetical protein [Actinomadura kijaniata]|nr:hypothetical protein [Actinomadura kijaniata]
MSIMISQAVTGGVAAFLVILMALGRTSLRSRWSSGSRRDGDSGGGD